MHDLGVDVPPAEVARRALELRPDVVGLSGLLTAAHASMKETVAELRRVAPQLGHPPVIIIGGGAVDEQVRDWSGADLWAADAVSGVGLIRAAREGLKPAVRSRAAPRCATGAAPCCGETQAVAAPPRSSAACSPSSSIVT